MDSEWMLRLRMVCNEFVEEGQGERKGLKFVFVLANEIRGCTEKRERGIKRNQISELYIFI